MEHLGVLERCCAGHDGGVVLRWLRGGETEPTLSTLNGSSHGHPSRHVTTLDESKQLVYVTTVSDLAICRGT